MDPLLKSTKQPDAKVQTEELFLVPFYEMPMKQNLLESWAFFRFGMSMFINTACGQILVFMMYYHMGKTDDSLILASFGIGYSFYTCAFSSIKDACYEVTSIQCAKWYGNRNFYMMSVSLGQGFL